MTSSMTIFAALLGSALGRSLSNELIGNFVVLPEQRVLLCTIDKRANTLPTGCAWSQLHIKSDCYLISRVPTLHLNFARKRRDTY